MHKKWSLKYYNMSNNHKTTETLVITSRILTYALHEYFAKWGYKIKSKFLFHMAWDWTGEIQVTRFVEDHNPIQLSTKLLKKGNLNDTESIETLMVNGMTMRMALEDFLGKKGYKVEYQALRNLIGDISQMQIVVSKVNYKYSFKKLEVTQKLLKVIAYPTTRKIKYDFKDVDEITLRAAIKHIIMTELSDFNQQIMIEIYELCPDIITKESTRRERSLNSVLSDLYPDGNNALVRYAEKTHFKIINFIKDRLFEKGIIKKIS